MRQVVIENPIINSPFVEPVRHFRLTEQGITDEIIEERRPSEHFMPIPRARKKLQQPDFLDAWTADKREINSLVNDIRRKVGMWRQGGYAGITRTSERLLEYWKNPERGKPLFFCQIEAVETLIYLTEVAGKYGDQFFENVLREHNEEANPGLYRLACKMATGSGKTVVMAMIIAWHTLNKLANPQDARFSDTFLIVTPGITIRDRLRVLLPTDPQNYYRERDVVPQHLMEELQRAKVLIVNFHQFKLREKKVNRLAKSIVQGRDSAGDVFTESPPQMVRRVCRELGNKRNILVLNDEAHHCYRHKAVDAIEEKLVGDERKEAESREEAARLWITGLEHIKAKIGIRAIYDLSATPSFLRGSGYHEGDLFPWVVSDFSLIDAIESGIVKVPRVPVSDDRMTDEMPTYRHIWPFIAEHMPKRGIKKTRKDIREGGEGYGEAPDIPTELEGAIHSLYSNYRQSWLAWEAVAAGLPEDRRPMPPVFIFVCNNTTVSKMVYDYISGWEQTLPDGTRVIKSGELELFRNHDDSQRWLHRPVTILVDSEQLDSGEAMTPDFKKIAEREIIEFKEEYRRRFPGRSGESLTDEDLLREVMNTVGKRGKLGEHVRCVVSVSMLTEGWDTNTVTHILGVRAFGTQLLCEQVVGRGLRRMSYDAQPRTIEVNGQTHEILAFAPEYAEVYGVPFAFIPCAGTNGGSPVSREMTRVRALDEREALAIRFPRVVGYRYQVDADRLGWRFDERTSMPLSPKDVPTWTEVSSIIGEREKHRPEELRGRRPQQVAFRLARRVLERYFRAEGGVPAGGNGHHAEGNGVQAWLFPQVLAITQRWMDECVRLEGGGFLQMLLLIEKCDQAAEKIHLAIAGAEREPGRRRLMPILAPYDPTGSTHYVDFTTAKPVWETRPDKCHLNYVVADTNSWEQKMAQNLEEDPRVLRYVKNHNLDFKIPYSLEGREHNYVPDFIAVIDDGHGPDDPLNLIIEVTGEKKKEKEAKVATARNLWVPAVNNHGGFGRWGMKETTNPWKYTASKLMGAHDDRQG